MLSLPTSRRVRVTYTTKRSDSVGNTATDITSQQYIDVFDLTALKTAMIPLPPALVCQVTDSKHDVIESASDIAPFQ